MGTRYRKRQGPGSKWRGKHSGKHRLAIGGLEIAAVATALCLVFSSPIAMGDPTFHRGLQHPALRLFGERYEVAYNCPAGASRLAGKTGISSVRMPFEGARYYHYLAWNHDDAIRYSASIEPACRIARLVHVRRRWFRRRFERSPVVGSAET